MPDLIDIFQRQPEKYDLLVSKENYRNNLLKKILALSGINRKSIVLDMGTGRIAYLLADYVKKIYAFDQTDAMVNCTRQKNAGPGNRNIEFAVAGNTAIPLAENSVDLAIEG